MPETLLSSSNVILFGRELTDLKITPAADNQTHDPFAEGRKGGNRLLQAQLTDEEGTGSNKKRTARFARIYGFSYEGTYYDLPRPTLFLVHGGGVDAESLPAQARIARSPDNPSRTGLAAADFSFADGLKVWSYDKADYTVRMDVETGTFEQVLLDAYFADGSWVSGMKVGGPRVSGMKVSGMKVSGMKLTGARFGGRGDGTE